MTTNTYDVQLTATGGTPPYTWTLAGGSNPLPAGLQVQPNGRLTGTPSTAGTSNFTIQLTDSASATATRGLSLRILDRLRAATTHPPDGVIGQGYSHLLQATGGVPPYSWSLAPGSQSLVPGLSLDTSGLISGVPTQQFQTAPTFGLVDSGSQSLFISYVIRVWAPVQVTTSMLPDGDIGVPYSAFLNAVGGTGNYQWSIAPGSPPLPAGLQVVSNSNHISGTPLQAGNFSVIFQVDGGGNPPVIGTVQLNLFIDNQLALLTQSLIETVIGQPFSFALQGIGGTPPYQWSVDRPLPNGLTLDLNTGIISGVSTVVDSSNYLFTVTDSSSPPQTASSFIPLAVRPLPTFSTTTIQDGVVTVSYQNSVRVFGGLTPYSSRIFSGNLPQGLSLDSSPSFGSITIFGSPAAAGTSNFGLEVSDSSTPPLTVSATFAIRIFPRLVISPATLPEGLEGNFYTLSFAGSGGLPPYYWQGSSLPPGLTMDLLTGQLSGTPTRDWSFNVLIGLGDSASPAQSVSLWTPLKITGRLEVLTKILPPMRLGLSARFVPARKGGTSPFLWSIAVGQLPAGLSLNASTGEINGTPSTTGTNSFTLRVTDTGTIFPQSYDQPLIWAVVSSPGRNDSVQTATPISYGTYRATLSPYVDPVGGPGNADQDFYRLTVNAGEVISIETFAQRLMPSSLADTVVEILDANGVRLNTCSPFANSSNTNPCLSDDSYNFATTDSLLYFKVPGAPGTPVTFYVHVLDWSGDARPEFLYEISITGAN